MFAAANAQLHRAASKALQRRGVRAVILGFGAVVQKGINQRHEKNGGQAEGVQECENSTKISVRAIESSNCVSKNHKTKQKQNKSCQDA
jgi:hypothetical protein